MIERIKVKRKISGESRRDVKIAKKQDINKQTPNGMILFKYKPSYNVTSFGVCFIFLVISIILSSLRDLI